MPGGSLKFAGIPVTDPPGAEGAGEGPGPEPGTPPGPGVGGPEEAARGGGAPRLSRWKALIFAAISGFKAAPPPLPIVLGGGLLAAFTLPRGVDEGVMPAVGRPGPAVEALRGDGLEGNCWAAASDGSRVCADSGAAEGEDSRGLPSLGESMAAGGRRCMLSGLGY